MESRQERRRREREERNAAKRASRHIPQPNISYGGCRFPALFDGPGCCICGHSDATECPCNSFEALAHLEREHPDQDSQLMREAIGCPITSSEPVPSASRGSGHAGEFQAPCGSVVFYETPMSLPTMGHYRWHSVYDHLNAGACPTPSQCKDALRTGNV